MKHGMFNKRIYTIWSSMKQRCNNKNKDNYKWYGARGIKICDEWQNDFVPFYEWSMNNGYKDNLCIDRINNDGNYEPSNCQWITNKENCAVGKRRTNPKTFKNGVSYDKSRDRYKARVWENPKSINIGYYKTEEEALKAVQLFKEIQKRA